MVETQQKTDMDVKKFQALLNVAGFETYPDGDHGPDTTTAAYQYADSTYKSDSIDIIENYGKMDKAELRAAVTNSIKERIEKDPAFEKQVLKNAIELLKSGDQNQREAGQMVMNELSIRGKNGKALVVDGDVGTQTEFAIETAETLLNNGVFSPLKQTFENAVVHAPRAQVAALSNVSSEGISQQKSVGFAQQEGIKASFNQSVSSPAEPAVGAKPNFEMHKTIKKEDLEENNARGMIKINLSIDSNTDAPKQDSNNNNNEVNNNFPQNKM